VSIPPAGQDGHLDLDAGTYTPPTGGQPRRTIEDLVREQATDLPFDAARFGVSEPLAAEELEEFLAAAKSLRVISPGAEEGPDA
jgi:hypothetical protein